MFAFGCAAGNQNTLATSPQTSYAEATAPTVTGPTPAGTVATGRSTADPTQGGRQGVYGATGQTGSTGQYGAGGSFGQYGATGASGSMSPTGPGNKADVTDQDIAAIITAANRGEIKEAQLADARASTPDVKTFAANMIAQHGLMFGDPRSFGVTPNETNTQSQQMEAEVRHQLDDWKSKTGQEFDRAYIDAQVEAHQKLLHDLDTVLIPNARNPQLRAALTQARGHVDAHLQAARGIQARL